MSFWSNLPPNIHLHTCWRISTTSPASIREKSYLGSFTAPGCALGFLLHARHWGLSQSSELALLVIFLWFGLAFMSIFSPLLWEGWECRSFETVLILKCWANASTQWYKHWASKCTAQEGPSTMCLLACRRSSSRPWGDLYPTATPLSTPGSGKSWGNLHVLHKLLSLTWGGNKTFFKKKLKRIPLPPPSLFMRWKDQVFCVK